jgi:hypothetical protein
MHLKNKIPACLGDKTGEQNKRSLIFDTAIINHPYSTCQEFTSENPQNSLENFPTDLIAQVVVVLSKGESVSDNFYQYIRDKYNLDTQQINQLVTVCNSMLCATTWFVSNPEVFNLVVKNLETRCAIGGNSHE